MSKIMEIYCDAPGCKEKRQESNNWFVLRQTTDDRIVIEPMHGHKEALGDQHICSSKCVHDVVEAYIQSHMEQMMPKEPEVVADH